MCGYEMTHEEFAFLSVSHWKNVTCGAESASVENVPKCLLFIWHLYGLQRNQSSGITLQWTCLVIPWDISLFLESRVERWFGSAFSVLSLLQYTDVCRYMGKYSWAFTLVIWDVSALWNWNENKMDDLYLMAMQNTFCNSFEVPSYICRSLRFV